MKQEFLNFINSLMQANPEVTNRLMTDNIQSYLNLSAHAFFSSALKGRFA